MSGVAIFISLQMLLISLATAKAQLYCATNNGEITITHYNSFTGLRGNKSRKETLPIPDNIGGLPVVSIGASCFRSCGNVTNILIPETVTSIGFGAFSGCHDLVEITIPKSVTKIGEVAFSYCINLRAISVDPLNPVYGSVDGVLIDKKLNELVECPGGKAGAFDIPDSITAIQDNAFTASVHLTSVKIPNSVRRIDWHAFMSCTALTNVTIGSGVTSIGGDSGWIVFSGCSRLTAITVDPLNHVFRDVDGVLMDKTQPTLIKFPEGKTGGYVIPDGVVTIGSHAFSRAENMTSVTIPASVETIEEYAFENCAGLTNVTFGSHLKRIGRAAFVSCARLTGISLPPELASVGDAAFYGCNGLTNVTFGKRLSKIGKNAFPDRAVTITADASNPTYASKNGGLSFKNQARLPQISVNDPKDGALINASLVDVQGTFRGNGIKQITVKSTGPASEMPATITGQSFEARNIWLQPGTNTITVAIEDIDGNTNATTLTVMGPANADTPPILPVQIKITPDWGFAPLTVTLKVEAHVPGKIEKVFYDFDGGNVQVATSLRPVTHTYKTSGQYSPIVTIQTSVGRFSSVSSALAMLAAAFGNQLSPSINVPSQPIVLSTIKITDPVDVKWTANSNLYVLSGSTATVAEFDAQGRMIRSKNQIGSNPSGFAVDAAGNVYVAVTGNNQIWKFKPTVDSFEADASFGSGGFIGNKDGSAGSQTRQFNAPYDVALSHNGGGMIVSDSGNRRVLPFDLKQMATPPSPISFPDLRDPAGVAYDAWDNFLFIVDSGSDRIFLNYAGFQSSGTNGDALGQFNRATHLAANGRALYVADTGNNRVQVFNRVEGGEMHSPVPFDPRSALSGELGLNHPRAVAPVEDPLEEKLYIADTGNNRVLLVELPLDNPEAMWKHLIDELKAGDAQGALSCFSFASTDKYREAFLAMSKDDLRSMAKDMEKIKPASIETDQAQYYFEKVIEGKTITFPVQFDREFGQWKVIEY